MKNTFAGIHILTCMWALCLPCVAQTLTSENHCPQATDSITLYAIPYQTMADSGEHCVWDFGKIEERANKAMNVDLFSIPSNTAALGVHCLHQNRYYRYANDTLYYVGNETARQKTTFEKPVLILKYPFAYGDTILRHFCCTENYAHKRTFAIEGDMSVRGKATGTLIASGDTIGRALYVETIEQYKKIEADTINMERRTGQWYIGVLRYPIITSCRLLCNDSNVYARMWYYPTTIQQNRKQKQWQTKPQQETAIQEENTGEMRVYYTNPVDEKLNIQYAISESAYIRFALYSHTGTLLYQSDIIQETDGTVNIPTKNLPQGVYTLYIETDKSQISREIIKQ